ncbi:Ig-like domain-containing protein [Mariniflexile sp. HMF6888]|uniref:Ig-like domain-containing protein n=1 Tax=Mariniflexile sp. HMF6888 TaxID=3373086 RepID=UPI0037A0F029
MQGLLDAIIYANSIGNVDIILDSGTYEYDTSYVSWITFGLGLFKDNITIRSKTGNRDDVIIKGKGMNGNISSVFQIFADNITIANVTLGWVTTHAIQVKGDADADNFLAHNVRFVDTYQQMVKVSYSSSNPNITGDNGIIRYCSFEYSAGIGPQWYIGGIDCHAGKNWIVKDNVFRDIVSPENNLAEHAIHFWSNAENTLVEGNLITNCDRGIGFGLGDRGHGIGVIKNNMVHTTRDVGIGLENANGVKVYNNTVVSENYPFSIEYRFVGTNAIIKNNLCNAAIELRNDASGELSSNIQDFPTNGFVDYEAGDLHLKNNEENMKLLVDKGEDLAEVLVDIDQQKRPFGKGYDIGADELVKNVKRIQVTPTVLNLRPNESRQLRVKILPFDVYYKSATWKSSDTLVAIVDENGKVKAISPGSAIITVTTSDGAFTDQSYVNVQDQNKLENENIKVYPVPFKNGDLSIDLDSSSPSKIIIRSLFRQELIYNVDVNTESIKIPRNLFKEGLYIINIYQGDKVTRKTITVE